MTHQQILAIEKAALLAAECALDAFGSDPDSVFPSAEQAWDFLNKDIYIEGGVKRPDALPESFPNEFKYDYYSHLCNLVSQRALV